MMYIWAMLKLDGRPAEVVKGELKGCARAGCSQAASARLLFRCVSGCMSCTWICQECMVEEHWDRPLDRIEV